MTVRRLVIATTERSGSTLLASMLKSHPQLQGEFEPLSIRARAPRDWRGKLDDVLPMPRLNAMTAAAEAAGAAGCFCKIFPFHTRRYAPLLRRLARDGWLVLELQRESVFRQALSRMAAHRLRRFHTFAGTPEDVEPQRFPRERFIKHLAFCEAQRREMEAACAPLERLTLVYERDLADRSRQQATFDRVTDFLGVAPHTAITTHERPFKQPYHEIITNYEELETAARDYLARQH